MLTKKREADGGRGREGERETKAEGGVQYLCVKKDGDNIVKQLYSNKN